MDFLATDTGHRIGKELAELAFTLNTPLKVDLAIMYHDGDITRKGEIMYGDSRGEPFAGRDAAEMFIIVEQVCKFEQLCSNVCGVNLHLPVNAKADDFFHRVLRHFGSPENAKIFEIAIVHGTDGLLKEEVLEGVSWVDGQHLVGLAVLVDDFIEAMLSPAEELHDSRSRAARQCASLADCIRDGIEKNYGSWEKWQKVAREVLRNNAPDTYKELSE